ncbi:MAG: FKBP-type peptidyl-prolyl cis-trans isomerase [Deltaproteobacteria bacterium]|nr:MAG: FKBP-type peptidyl-prolyl cis-trans isomerase [Deltaproteobacteria bacterium]
MAQANVGDKVRILYSGSLEDGTVIGASPLEAVFTIGEKSVLPGFENAVIGMNEGDTKRFSLTPEDAFGHRREDMVFNVERSTLPSNIDLELGKAIQISADDGELYDFTVVDINDNNVILDANHPLAGKTLNFNIELVEID